MHSFRKLVISSTNWCSDDLADVCGNRLCQKKLFLLTRKYKCNFCGKTFCGDCAPRIVTCQEKSWRRCNACCLPHVFRSIYCPVTRRREGTIAELIMSFLDGRSINALLQSCFAALSEFHVDGCVYHESIKDRFPSFFEGARVGEGVTGTVYMCEDRSRLNNPRVAIKVIRKSNVFSFQAWRKITRELDIMKEIDHPNLSHLLEVFQTPHHLVIVMEAGDGGSLKKVWEFVRTRRCDLEVFVASVVGQVAEGLDYLYRVKHIVHRDIKHDNIVLSRDFTRVIIIDFGLAEYINEGKRQVFTPCGTFGFLSPENIFAVLGHMRVFEASGSTMHRADMFSLGVVAYTLLTGVKPFKSRTFSGVCKEVVEGVSCTGQLWENVSDGAKSLVEMLLKTSTKERATASNVCKHSFILANAPRITEIAKKRNHELFLLDRAESSEWIYVVPSNNHWDLVTDEEIERVSKPTNLVCAAIHQ